VGNEKEVPIMTPNESKYADLQAILPSLLTAQLQESAEMETQEPPSTEELFDLVEGRLSATEREELIERIASSSTAQAALADLLAGVELSEALGSTETALVNLFEGAWDRVKSWFRPQVLVPLLSVCLLLMVALPLVMEGPSPTHEGIRDVDENFFLDEEPIPTPTVKAVIESATGEIQSATPN
jgi:hypothetical protein